MEIRVIMRLLIALSDFAMYLMANTEMVLLKNVIEFEK